MKIEHIAVCSNSEEKADEFFINLLELKKVRSFVVSDVLMEQFFKIKRKQKIIRYENEDLRVEAFITDDKNQALDRFTHTCLIIEDRIKLIERAKKLNIEVIQVPRKDSDNFYLFLKDSYGNLFEIKSQ
ncbi:MAG: VOC family protein [Candidatus Lokiarchaeota archaeon]|nr:VOC family protein [Candidatus Lokiarchaeota archaeon]